MKKLSRGERLWVAGLLILALLLGIKSWRIDPWVPQDADESAWLAAAQEAMAQEPDSWFLERGILTERIVGIKAVAPADPEEPSALKITVRSYVAGYLPFGDRKITLPLAESNQ